MVEIVIRHTGSIPNVDAMEACILFAYENYHERHGGYLDTREVKTKRGYNLEVKEVEHPGVENSRCSAVFVVKNLDID